MHIKIWMSDLHKDEAAPCRLSTRQHTWWLGFLHVCLISRESKDLQCTYLERNSPRYSFEQYFLKH